MRKLVSITYSLCHMIHCLEWEHPKSKISHKSSKHCKGNTNLCHFQMGRVTGKGTFGQLTSILKMTFLSWADDINSYGFRGKNTILLSKCVTKSLFSYEKIKYSCNFILNIVTTKMSQNMTEGTFSRGVPQIILILCNPQTVL
jgi:hypothetical protein